MTLAEVGQWASPVLQLAILVGGVFILYGKQANKEDVDGRRLLTTESDVRKLNEASIRQEMKVDNLESLDNKVEEFREEFVEYRAESRSQMAALQTSVNTLTRQMEGLARGIGRLASGDAPIRLDKDIHP